MDVALEIRLLGELRLTRAGGALALPASKKTRALLGYLIATGQSHRRERLCDLLWDGPDDPRAELRWSLSKIRPLLGEALVADRERVGIALDGVRVDLLDMRARLRAGVVQASTADLDQAAAMFGGEFLDGLDLPACYRFQEWCMAERETVSRLRLAVLGALVSRQDDAEAALPHARALAVADPLSEEGHAAVVRLLARLGRHREAASHYARARRLFETELGAPPAEALEEAGRALQTVADAPATPVTVAPRAAAPAIGPEMVGRKAEQALTGRLIKQAAAWQPCDVLMVTGEPGIGKTHLLDAVAAQVRAVGGAVFRARAFEPEATRPYGVWFDMMRAIAGTRRRGALPGGLALLLPEIGEAAAGDRNRLFAAVTQVIREVAAEQPVALLFDDVQWIDEASSALLHAVARQAVPSLLIVCAARAGEIEDNAAASGVLRSLARDRRLLRVGLDRLDAAETDALVRRVDALLDAPAIFAQSDGNPLFTLELARAQRGGDSFTMETVITGQLARLGETARDVLLWAAAHGRAVAPEDLGRSAGLDDAELLAALEELERRGLLRPMGEDAYVFAHDLVRQAAYGIISQPRRRLMHRQIARALDTASRCEPAFAADLAYHAALAGDDAAAARGCAAAGERALRLLANADAAGFAERGLHHAARMPETVETVELRIALLRLRILAAAGPGMRPLPPLSDAVADVTRAAEAHGLQSTAATGHYLLSVLQQEAGDAKSAVRSTLRAAAAGRSADEVTRVHQLANTARCLLELETEIARSRELIREGSAIVAPLGLELCELHWARGLLARWDGEAEAALAALGHALDLARRDEDRWREYKCLTWLAMLTQELGRYDEMRARCEELRAVAARIGEDETPFVATLQALALLATGETGAALAAALPGLRQIDDKSYLAYALNCAARLHLRAGRLEKVRACAAEALAAATAIRRGNEIAIARAMLAKAGAPDEHPPFEFEILSARARATLRDLSNGGFHGDAAV